MFKFSVNYSAIRKRIGRIPTMIPATMMSIRKRDAMNMIKNFHDGIKSNKFGLQRLSDGTIKRKTQQGMERPSVPLYGRGDESKDRSYMNSLRLRQLKNGYRVFVSTAKHHSGKLKLIDLYNIHEHGSVFRRGESLINIPPRPAFEKAYLKTLKELRIKETTKQVKKVYAQFIKAGKENIVLKYNAHNEKLVKLQNMDIEE